MLRRPFLLALACLVCAVLIGATPAWTASLAPAEVAQASPQPPAAASPPAAPAADAPAGDAQTAAEEPIGNVATLTGTATVVRHKDSIALKLKDDIYLNDLVQTSAGSALGITFNDSTTFNLSANARITIDNYVYEEGGKRNAAIFDVARGTVAFVAAAVAKTGDMKITTPTATLGIRGTTGLVEVPEGATAGGANNVAIKLYPDADGRVGRIEVNDRTGARLGFLTQGASGFTIRPGTGGVRFAAVPLSISPQQALRDQGFVRQVHAAQDLGRRIVTEQRAFRRANPNFNHGNQLRPQTPQRQNGLPGQNRQNLQQPRTPGRQNLQAPGTPKGPNPAAPKVPGRQGLRERPGTPQQPGSPPQGGQKLTPAQGGPPRLQNVPPRQGGLQPGAPRLQRPLLPNRPALRKPAAPAQREKKEKR